MKLFVIPGHGAGDPGACGHGFEEAERVRALARKIKEQGGDSVILADFSRNYYEDNGISYLDLPEDTQIVELHMDSGPSSARGGHVIIQEGIGGADDYDKALAVSIAKIFPGRSQTLVERGDLANPARAAIRGYGYRLVENGFISNASDVKTFNDKMEAVAQGYLKAFGITPNTKEPSDANYKVIATPSLNVRTKPSSVNGKTVGVLKRGAKIHLVNVKKNKVGNTWAKIASGTFKGRYVAVVFHGERYCKKL